MNICLRTIGAALVVCASWLAGFSSLALAQEPEYVRQLEDTVVFIYDGSVDACAPPPPGYVLLPLGTGFVSGIPKKGIAIDATTWTGVKFLITTQHVVAGRTSINLRLNKTDGSGFTCFPLNLNWTGEHQDAFTSEKPETDLVAIYLPRIPDTDPAVLDYRLIADRATADEMGIQEGTEILTIGYVWGYSGKSRNYAVMKFGRIALLTEENWYHSEAPRSMDEKAYLIELQNTPGMSGAPVILKSPQIRVGPGGALTYRREAPYVLGVVKGLLTVPLPDGSKISQGLAAIQPAADLKELLQEVGTRLESEGFDLDLTTPPVAK